MTDLQTTTNPETTMGYSILFVEDDDDDAEILKSVLIKDRRVAQAVHATNGEEALDWLEHAPRKPDLVIVDLNMPVLDGHAFLTRLKLLRGYKNVPVAVLTSSSMAADYHRSLVRRADTFITKPDEFQGLVSVMSRLVDHLAWDVKFPCLLAA
jgi:CheY-like chemotaxis protein